MALQYNITNILSITNANAHMNALLPETVNNDSYEMAFIGVANFLSGNYIQNSDDVNNIKSHLLVDSGALNNAHFFYVANVDTDNSESYPAGGESSYGSEITQTGTLFGSSAVTNVADSTNAAVTVDSLASFGNEFIAMTNISNGTAATVVDSTQEKLLANQSSVGDGLLQAVTAALFKKLGKNAALLNDTNLITALNTKFHAALEGEMKEENSDYGNSKFFKRYLATGRYEKDIETNADINSPINYNLNNTLVNMVINISGQVNDTDGASGGPDLSSNTAAINQIFGTVNTDHKVSVEAGTVGVYDIKVFVSLRHDDRF